MNRVNSGVNVQRAGVMLSMPLMRQRMNFIEDPLRFLRAAMIVSLEKSFQHSSLLHAETTKYCVRSYLRLHIRRFTFKLHGFNKTPFREAVPLSQESPLPRAKLPFEFNHFQHESMSDRKN